MPKNTAVVVKKTAAVGAPIDEEKLALMRQAFPVEERATFMLFPRLTMVSQDKMEEVKNAKTGKKEIKIITAAGTFCTQIQDEEESEVEEETIVKGKKKIETVKKRLWQTEEIGDNVTGIIIFQRKQLKFFDEASDAFISSAIYDKDTDIVPLFSGKKEIARGTPKELQEPHMKLKKGVNGKPDKNVSDLKDNRILYVYVPEFEKVFQLTVAGTSMYSYLSYAGDVKNPSEFVTTMSSELQENGNIKWNKMTFETVRGVNADEVDLIVQTQADIIKGIQESKAFFASKDAEKTESDKALDDF